MNVDFLIQLLDNKLSFLRNARVQAFNTGDLAAINSLDEEIVGVQDTLVKLRLLVSLSNTAANSGNTEAELIASGIEAVKNAPVIPENPTSVLASYDLSTYATDPLYLQKITDILAVMGAMDTPQAIDAYIDSEAIGSPLNGTMILAAAAMYQVDTRLLVAILELESNFGTAGVAVTTLNPGNVGNTGSKTRTYETWQDGVAAVAYWLSRHPGSSLPTEAQPGTPGADAAVVSMDPSAYVDSVPVAQTPAPTPSPEPSPAPAPSPEPPLPSAPAGETASSVPPTVLEPEPVATTTPATSTPPVVPDVPAASSTPEINFDPGFIEPTSTPPVVPDVPAASSTPVVTSVNTSTQNGAKKLVSKSGIRIWKMNKPQT